ncbi:phosphatase PAP2 family protein [Streptomyces sp. NPDC001546]|uniref:phosphatase PAP2 family protein n=1 Tax=Streptomyces sp. NPDC001546 TaxID=3364585 RepID=UPI00369132C3
MTSHTSHTAPGRPPAPAGAARRRLIRELLLVASLFAVYKAGRMLSTGRTEEAQHNAARVWDAERALHLPGEGAVQRVLLHSDAAVHAANTYYAAVHFPATVLFLVWLYLRRPGHYLWTRRVLAVLTGAALVLHLSFPLAPPRMLAAAHLVDTGQVYGPTVYRAAPAADTMANQFAAMPSLHFGWALMLALGMIAATRSRWRALWLLHPLATLVVVVGTANHYWADALVATLLLGAALLLIPRPATAVPAAPPGARLPSRATGAAATPVPPGASARSGVSDPPVPSARSGASAAAVTPGVPGRSGVAGPPVPPARPGASAAAVAPVLSGAPAADGASIPAGTSGAAAARAWVAVPRGAGAGPVTVTAGGER